MARVRDLAAHLGDALGAASDLVLPVQCAGCTRPGARWCAPCAQAMRRARQGRPPDGTVLPGLPPMFCAASFDGPLRAALTAYKDGGRHDLRDLLAADLAVAMHRALMAIEITGPLGHRVAVVPVPTSARNRRVRGADPIAALIGAAVALLDRPTLTMLPALDVVRAVADQSRLGRERRRANVAGALRVRDDQRAALSDLSLILADDVVTTGATVREGIRALNDAHADVRLVVTLGATPRR